MDHFTMRDYGVALLGTVLSLCTGCGDFEATEPVRAGGQGWTTMRLSSTDTVQAFAAADYAVRQWFPIEESLPARGSVLSKLVEYDQRGGTGRIRDAAVAYTNRMRRQAWVMIDGLDGGGVEARCRVSVQRRDTADHQLFRQNEQFSDLPNDTPIDRGAGVAPEREDVWTDMPRDRDLERQILEVVRNRLAGASGEMRAQ